MCYTVHLSTDAPLDLSRRNSDLVRFEKVTDVARDPCLDLLAYPNRWHVGSQSGCGYPFRPLHPSSLDLGFAAPVDWFPEEPEAVEATAELYGTLAGIVREGFRLDVLDRWEGAKPADIRTLAVTLSEVEQNAFRLFENHRFKCR